MGRWWNNADRQKLKFRKTETSPTVALSTTSHKWSESGTNPYLCSDKLTTQCLVPRHGPVLCSHLNVTLTYVPVINPNTVYILQQALTSVTYGNGLASSGSVSWAAGYTRFVFTCGRYNISDCSRAIRNASNEQNPNSCTFKVVRNSSWNRTQDKILRNLRYKNIHASSKDNNYNLPDT